MPHKLHLKRTPAEDAARQWKKARKAAKKAAAAHLARDYSTEDFSEAGPSTPYVWDFDFTETMATEPDHQAQDEEARFREKMDEAAEDDARLYGVESRLNDFATDTVPKRWRQDTGTMEVDPMGMDDDAYAEWIRAGMWKKKHAAEHAEQIRLENIRAEKRIQDKALREESRRLERETHERHQLKRQAKQSIRLMEEREYYDTRWATLLAPPVPSADATTQDLRFDDVPWPAHGSSFAETDISPSSIATFLMRHNGTVPRVKKDVLRETMLRFHPDKFEIRVLSRVCSDDRQRVKEAAAAVLRAANDLMKTD